MSPGRIVQIVATRGIEGVIFPVHRVFDFSLLTLGWSEFSLVGINDQRLGEWLDVVCPNYYHNTSVALRQLRQIGCVRIGLVLTPQFDAASNGTTHACFLRHLHSVPRSSRVPVCIAAKSSEPGSAMVARWLRDHCPIARRPKAPC